MRSLSVLVCFMSLVLFAGCAIVDRNVELTYKCANLASGKQGEFFVEKPKDDSSLPHNEKGQLDIGDVRNTYGAHTADVVTTSSAGDWIAYAYAEELKSAGYDVKTVEAMPDYVEKGVKFSFKNIYVDTDTGFWSIGVVANVKYDIIVWVDGAKAGVLSVEGAYQERGQFITDEMYGMAVRGALADAVQKSLPELLKIVEG